MDRFSAWLHSSTAPTLEIPCSRSLRRGPASRPRSSRARIAHGRPRARRRIGGAVLIGAATLALLAPRPAVAQILNGDFSAGLIDWTVGPGGGAVVVNGGAAALEEDFTVGFTALSQDLTIPVDAQALSFDFSYATVQDAASSGFPDALSAFLLDPNTGVSLVADAGSGEEYFNVDNGGVVFLPSGTTLDGSGTAGTVTLDLTGVPTGPATLLLELVGSDDGRTSTVTLDNVRITVPCPSNPADVNQNFDIEPGEMSGYGTCFLRRCTDWAGGGLLPPPPGYVSRVGTLFLRGGFGRFDYCCDPLEAAPLAWAEPGGCTPAPAVAGAQALDSTGEAAAMREFQQRGSSVDARIRIRPPSGSSTYAIEEKVPAGLAASGVSHGGVYHAEFGSIRWGPFLDHASRDLAYQLTADSRRELTGSVEGVVAFDGHETPILGQSAIPRRPGDADYDGDVDLADFLKMVECLSASATSGTPDCEVFDFDGDGDVDLADVVAFQAGSTAGP